MIFDAYEIDNRIKPNTYIVHTEGGYHMFHHRCSKDKYLNPLYREKIWPYVEDKNRIIWPGLTKKIRILVYISHRGLKKELKQETLKIFLFICIN